MLLRPTEIPLEVILEILGDLVFLWWLRNSLLGGLFLTLEWHNDYEVHMSLFYLAFGFLLIMSANGYIRRSFRYGYDVEIVLSLGCLTNAVLYMHLYGSCDVCPANPQFGMLVVVPGYGLLLACLLIWRYRGFSSREDV